jgi:hypothetical protein
VRKREIKIASMMTNISLIFSLVVFGFMVKVGNDGGKIRHTEISDAAAAQAPAQAGDQKNGEGDGD